MSGTIGIDVGFFCIGNIGEDMMEIFISFLNSFKMQSNFLKYRQCLTKSQVTNNIRYRFSI